ncbi:HD-GYP domain-containing protein [Lysinibacillus sphaericus]
MNGTGMKNVSELKEGDVLALDVYRENSLILKKGRIIDPAIIKRLQQFNIYSVNVEAPEEVLEVVPPDDTDYKRVFFNSITLCCQENRYGTALNKDETFDWVEDLFVRIMAEKKNHDLLDQIMKYDLYTFYHSMDVFILGALMGKRLKVKNLDAFAIGCLLHDIGKTQIPLDILLKPAKLTYEEYEEMKLHTILGYKVLRKHRFNNDINRLALYHHERINGSGYPKGLSGKDLSIESQIAGIVDVYSALTLNRPYRSAFGAVTALGILSRDLDLFDEGLIQQFCLLLEIFPVNSKVELSTGQLVEVVKVSDQLPCSPLMYHRKSHTFFSIPTNREIKIEQVIRFK